MASVQIRNVPPEIHRIFKERAERAGVSLQEYLLGELELIASTPTMDEVIARVRNRELYDLERTSAEIIAETRREREEQLGSR